MRKLSSSEKRLAGASALMFVLYSVPRWASFPIGEWLASVHGTKEVTALEGDFPTMPIAAIMTFAILAALALKALGVFDARSSVGVAKAYVGAAIVAAIAVFSALVTGPDTIDIGHELEGDRGPLLYVGVGLTIAMVVVAGRHLREVQGTSTASTSPALTSPALTSPPLPQPPVATAPLPPPSPPRAAAPLPPPLPRSRSGVR